MTLINEFSSCILKGLRALARSHNFCSDSFTLQTSLFYILKNGQVNYLNWVYLSLKYYIIYV